MNYIIKFAQKQLDLNQNVHPPKVLCLFPRRAGIGAQWMLVWVVGTLRAVFAGSPNHYGQGRKRTERKYW